MIANNTIPPIANNIERLELLREFWDNCLKEGEIEHTPLDEAVFEFIAKTQDAYRELQEIEEGDAEVIEVGELVGQE